MSYVGPNTFFNGCVGDPSKPGMCPPKSSTLASQKLINGLYPFYELKQFEGKSSGPYKWGFSSARCHCKQEPVSCKPTDGWNVLADIKNEESSVPQTYSYTKVFAYT